MRVRPPAKRIGQARKPRRFDGDLRDIAAQATAMGESQKALRAQVARGLIPYHRFGGRIIFVVAELERFFGQLPGVSPEEALRNVQARNGQRP